MLFPGYLRELDTVRVELCWQTWTDKFPDLDHADLAYNQIYNFWGLSQDRPEKCAVILRNS